MESVTERWFYFMVLLYSFTIQEQQIDFKTQKIGEIVVASIRRPKKGKRRKKGKKSISWLVLVTDSRHLCLRCNMHDGNFKLAAQHMVWLKSEITFVATMRR